MTRKEFVENFGKLMANAPMYETHGVHHMEFDEEKEIVSVYFGKDENELSIKKVNVAMDSCSAIMYDVIRYALH